MNNKFKICFVSIDVESDFAKSETYKGVEDLDKILRIFREYNIPATLFVTGDVLEGYREKTKKWARDYEIACHGFTHRFWNTLNNEERKEELEKFILIYERIFNKKPQGFRAPSHLIDEDGLRHLEEKGFLYDSSIIPRYPFFKKYRGYKGRAPVSPYWIREKILEIPVSGLVFGFPLAGTWLSKLPFFIYRLLFLISAPDFLTFNLHSWDCLDGKLLVKIERLLRILKNKKYQFLTGEETFQKFSGV